MSPPPELQQLAINFLATFLVVTLLTEQQPSYICTRPENFTIRNMRPLTIREPPSTGVRGYGGPSTGCGCPSHLKLNSRAVLYFHSVKTFGYSNLEFAQRLMMFVCSLVLTASLVPVGRRTSALT